MTDDLGRVDLTDLDTFADGFPHGVFRLHREVAPVWWHEPTAHTPDGEGFWSVACYDDVLRVLNDPLTFSSETGGSRPYGGTTIQDLPVAGVVLNMMDDPRHARIRRLVSIGLTPKAVADLERDLRARMRAILATVDAGDCDAVALVRDLPLQAIALLMGVPAGDRDQLGDWVDHSFDFKDRAYLESTDAVAAAPSMRATK